MRKNIYFYVLMVIPMLYSCTKDRSFTESKFTVDQAMDAFEQTVSDPNFNWPEGKEFNFFLDPGNFTPKWETARETSDQYIESVDMEIDSRYLYSGFFIPESGEYQTPITQKLVVVRDRATGEHSCFIMSVIPSNDYNIRYGDFAGERFHNLKADKDFSGFVVYSTLGVSVAVRIDKYEAGKVLESASLYDSTQDAADNIRAMNDVFGKARLARHAAVRTRGSEDDGWFGGVLDEAVVTGSKPGNVTIINIPSSYVPSGSGSNYDPNPSGSSGGGGSNGGGYSSSPIVNKVDYQIATKINAVIEEMKRDCLGNYLYKEMVNNGIKIDFILDPSIKNGAEYNPVTNAIMFKSTSNVNYPSMCEEFIHSMQRFYYATPYGTSMQSVYLNIEFEAKMIRELTSRDGFFKSGGVCCSTELYKIDGLYKWLLPLKEKYYDNGGMAAIPYKDSNIFIYEYKKYESLFRELDYNKVGQNKFSTEFSPYLLNSLFNYVSNNRGDCINK